ncbi:MAG: flagellar basal body rod protein FlgC [Myxococcota bacterium]
MANIFDAFTLAGRALSVQRARLDVASSNLANAQTTRTEQGGPYRRRDVVLRETREPGSFEAVLRGEADRVRSVEVDHVREDAAPPRLVFEPDHPDADSNGFVAYPNINTVEEMVNMITSMRSYQANLNVLSGLRTLAERALTIGRNF